MSSSQLQEQTKQLVHGLFGQYTIRENYRPAWLDGLELDLFIEDLALAIEVQGRQHFEYVPHFHGTYRGFQEQKERDKLKCRLCEQQGIVLLEIFSPVDFDSIRARSEALISINEKWDAYDQKRKNMEQHPDPKLRRIVKTLSGLHRRLERWRRKSPSGKRHSVLCSIESQMEIENERLMNSFP
jgi:hypothetical protein